MLIMSCRNLREWESENNPEVLLASYADGAYLVQRDTFNSNDYTVHIQHNKSVLHVKIVLQVCRQWHFIKLCILSLSRLFCLVLVCLLLGVFPSLAYLTG